MDSDPSLSGPTLRHLYPELDDSQLRTAEDNLSHYLELALRIYQRRRLAEFHAKLTEAGTAL